MRQAGHAGGPTVVPKDLYAKLQANKQKHQGKVIDWAMMESSSTTEREMPVCNACEKPPSAGSPPLKHCAKCKTNLYCSRECQRADWKTHRKVCGRSGNDARDSHEIPTGFTMPDANASTTEYLETMFKNFSLNAWTTDRENIFANDSKSGYLSRLSEQEVFAALIDSYRLRLDDEYTFHGDASGLYGGGNPLPGFRDFLNKAERCEDVIPAWWNREKRRECERLAMRRTGWSSIYCAVQKSDIIEHYGDRLMPMRLRMLSEKITGSPIRDGFR